jgi:predicted amino acid dehydrogenase
MKFATIGHLDYEKRIEQIPKEWIQKSLIISPEFNFKETQGHFIVLKLTAKQMMTLERAKIRRKILEAARFAYDKLNVELIQLGALTTSVTDGGVWLAEQKEYAGLVNHGDSYTAATTAQAVIKSMNFFKKIPSDQTLAIVGAYGVIGEALSKILVPKFSYSFLIGRREQKLKELESNLKGDFKTTIELETAKYADVVVTATNHPTALLKSEQLKKNAIVIDVSQPPNVSQEICQIRPDICRMDGGYVDVPGRIQLPGMPVGKIFACIAEVIMQSIENERMNHVGSIDLEHLKKTERWADMYGYKLNELTNFGRVIQIF